MVNSHINPLTAILRCKNGLLFSKEDGVLTRVMDSLLHEASQVLQALVNHNSSTSLLSSSASSNSNGNLAFRRIATTGDTADSIESVRAILVERFSYARLRSMLYAVGAKVGENTSSMLQDVQAGKQTEIKDFNGWLVDTASFIDPNLNVSGHKKLISLVREGKVLKPEDLGRCILG